MKEEHNKILASGENLARGSVPRTLMTASLMASSIDSCQSGPVQGDIPPEQRRSSRWQRRDMQDMLRSGTRTDSPTRETVKIEQGTCYAFFAYDIALAINLDDAEQALSAVTQRGGIKRQHPAPAYFEYHPAPVRVMQEISPLLLGEDHSSARVDILLYDFGAASVRYSIPLGGSLTDLCTLSEKLYDNEWLLADSRQRMERLLTAIPTALTRPKVADLVEDYVVFHLESLVTPCSGDSLRTAYAPIIARMLRAEQQDLSTQEVQDAVSRCLSFSPTDMTIVDWHAALVVDHEGADVCAVLEFANIELLEMRFLDQLLDDALARSYETVSMQLRKSLWIPGSYRASLYEIAQFHIDSALLFEGVNNALKLVGDQYLARVYRVASERFHLTEWDSSILRKLQTLESLYEKINDQAASHRMEILEWIIILLIAISIVLPFFPGVSGH